MSHSLPNVGNEIERETKTGAPSLSLRFLKRQGGDFGYEIFGAPNAEVLDVRSRVECVIPNICAFFLLVKWILQ